ncbi:MAG: PQQ-binding-like beta-propeller repeat protein, partial [Lewinella sp.]|nr:PQQ-binding-like beta-propeller repeat protein [Lewinella sp.]
MKLSTCLLAGLLFILILGSCNNQNTVIDGGTAEGISPKMAGDLFNQRCATCHVDNGQSLAPPPVHLSNMSPRSIFTSLESGKMKSQGDSLSRNEKIALAELLTQRKYEEGSKNYNFCGEGQMDDLTVKYFGWGGDLKGSSYIDATTAGLAKAEVPQLKLKWAFGFEGGGNTRNKVTVIGHHIIFGSEFGEVYCLEMEAGCVRWVVEADAVVRGGIAISQDIAGKTIAYFADFSGNVFAVNAQTGELIWRASAKKDPNNAVTGTPVYFDGLLYVPLSSMEVVTAGRDSYACCRSSGQVVALNAGTGEEVWRHRVIQEAATEQGVSKAGVKKYGPSGAPVWCSPTVDAERGYLYIGTGENNSNPPTLTSDALQALDLKTGALIWNYQATPKDAYITACDTPGSANCPDPPGPDVDFGMAPILTTRTDGKEVLVVGQKSGVVHCLDPDTGQPIW